MSTNIGFSSSTKRGLLAALAALAVATTADAATLHVPADHGTIQEAIDAAADGDTVLVAPGEYVITEPIDFNRLHDPDDPASPPVKNIQVRSEGGADVTTIRMSETPAYAKRAMVAVFESGETAASVLEGFTLAGGQGTLSLPEGPSGSAVSCRSSSPTIAGCTITGNLAIYGGGAVSCRGASPTLTNCTIVANSGGGVRCEGNSSPILETCRISGNSGGGVDCRPDSSPSLTSCTISENGGAGISCWGSSPTLNNCTLSGNLGDGVNCGAGSSPTLTSSIIWGNAGGSLVADEESAPSVSFSCVEAAEVWQGEGNIDSDPLFCGWSAESDVFVDAAAGPGGDGTKDRPFAELAPALDYSLALRKDSPCIGAGKDGSNMGASHGVCEEGGPSERLVRLAAGRYRIEGLTLARGTSIEGVSREETVIEGTLWGLGTGSKLSRVTVTGGREGGVVVGAGESPIVEDCTISDNFGAGVACGAGSLPDLRGCFISRNSRGVSCGVDSSPTLTDCTISRNSGSGLSCGQGSSPILTNCTISGNSGGGVYCDGASPSLTDCTISGNSASVGGGVYCARCSATLTNCTISGNSATERGGGVSCGDGSSPTLTNCTVADNSAADGGGVYSTGGSSPTLKSCIVWGNAQGSLVAVEGGSLRISFSCIEAAEVWQGEGNTNSDPLFCGWSGRRDVFVDAAAGPGGDGTKERPFPELTPALEYSLALGKDSPCIGAGEGGSDMGAAHGVCEVGEATERAVHVAAGRYGIEGLTLAHGASLEGASREETVVEGTVLGLCTDAKLARVTVTGGKDDGVVVGAGESPVIEDCTISGNSRFGVNCAGSPSMTNCTVSMNLSSGIYCGPDSTPTLTGCTISGNSSAGVYCGERSSPTLTDCTISRSEGDGVSCQKQSSPTLKNCTILENSHVGVSCAEESFPTLVWCTVSGNLMHGVLCVACTLTLTSSIVWDNAGESLAVVGGTVKASFSCVEAEEVWQGQGNIDADPLFCGWKGPTDVFVDAAAAPGGDGTRDRPFAGLSPALEYSLALRKGSPCIAGGEAGSDMGAAHGICEGGGPSERVVHVAVGRYGIEGLTLAHGASLEGASREETVIEGTVLGLRAGAKLARVTVTGGRESGVFIGTGESPLIEDCTISGNSAELFGGGVLCSEGSSPTLSRCTIWGNSAWYGGGVYCGEGSSPTLTDCTISGNYVQSMSMFTGMGGGVYCSSGSSLTMRDCRISGNWADSFGGLFCYGSSTLTSCTVSGNWRGGVQCYGSSTLANCTIWGNSGVGLIAGGDPSAAIAVTNCTIAGSSDYDVGCGEASSFTLTNCIVWGNGPQPACGTFSHCLTDRDPLFVKAGALDFERRKTVKIQGQDCNLPDFIVEEPDYRLQPGSPAIDSGTSEGAPTTDIDGHGRPCGAGVDIGAYEMGDCPPDGTRFVRGDVDASGDLQITDPIRLLNHLFLGGEEPKCLDAADADDSGTLDITDAIHSLNFQFLGGAPPKSPFPGCGIDGWIDALGCREYSPCQ